MASLKKKFAAVNQKMRGFMTFGSLGYSLQELPSVRGKVYLNKFGSMTIGKSIKVIGRPWPTQLTVDAGAQMYIGSNVFINAGCGIAASKEIRIGNHVRIGPRTSILDNDYHLLDADVSSEQLKRPVIIEDNVWIGTRCTILPGVTIGKNSVVAAGSVVNKDVPPNVVVAGVPAKVIKKFNVPEDWIRN
ncbi:acyltransferase [Marinicrinis lubricantis]|uniref:Acyltransferase n=1 Tax=Marinicrinis lubricantis TaxID=2086470 RepID=A0ABW1IJU7_9BACL